MNNPHKYKRGKQLIVVGTGEIVTLDRVQESGDYFCLKENETFDVYSPDEVKEAVKQRPPINKVSDDKKKEDRVYNTLRLVFLENKTACQIKLPGCTIKSTEVHHLFSGSNRSKYYLITSEWLAACRNCHDKVHNEMSKDEAIERGFKKTE